MDYRDPKDTNFNEKEIFEDESNNTILKIHPTIQTIIELYKNNLLRAGCIIYGLDSEYLYIGDDIAKYAGLDIKKFIGKKPTDISDSQHRNQIQQQILDVLEFKKSSIIEFSVKIKETGKIWNLRKFAEPIISDGEVVGIIATFTDIAEQKKLEKEKADLEKLIIELHRVLENIKKIKDGKSIISKIAEKYRKDAQYIFQYLDVLKTGNEIDSNKLEESMNACRKILKHTEILQKLSEEKEYKKTSLDIYKVISDIFASGDIINDDKIKTIIGFNDKEFLVNGVESLIKDIFIEVFRNATQAINDKGSNNIDNLIEINADNYKVTGIDKTDLPFGDYVHISIQDTGKGMTKEEIERVFDIFYTTKQVDSSKIYGVGLNKIYKIIIDLGGYIDIESIEGVGTTVHIYLQRIISQEKKALNKTFLSYGNGEEILIVTESKENLDVLERLLILHNFKPFFVKNKKEGLKKLIEYNNIKLVIVDSGKGDNKMILRLLQENTLENDSIFSSEKTGNVGEKEIIIDKTSTQFIAKTIENILE